MVKFEVSCGHGNGKFPLEISRILKPYLRGRKCLVFKAEKKGEGIVVDLSRFYFRPTILEKNVPITRGIRKGVQLYVDKDDERYVWYYLKPEAIALLFGDISSKEICESLFMNLENGKLFIKRSKKRRSEETADVEDEIVDKLVSEETWNELLSEPKPPPPLPPPNSERTTELWFCGLLFMGALPFERIAHSGREYPDYRVVNRETKEIETLELEYKASNFKREIREGRLKEDITPNWLAAWKTDDLDFVQSLRKEGIKYLDLREIAERYFDFGEDRR